MNHYPHHIGDFNNATRHLTRVERSLYRDLIELYYDTEQPLNSDTNKIARRVLANTEEERAALLVVLDEFFVLQDDGWHNARCDSEIAKYKGQIEQASKAGKASAAKRSNKKPAPNEQPFNDRSTTVDSPLNQPEPEPEPVIEANASVASKLPTCPTQAVIDLYHEVLPELPTVRLLNDQRRKAIANFWRWVLTSKRRDGTPRAQTSDQALTWISGYFARAKQNDFLMGRIERNEMHAGWRCDLDFLLTEKGKKHVIEKTEVAA